MIKPVIDSFKNNNSYEQATMGVYAYDKEVIPYLDSNINFGKGIYVVQIIKNGPASKTDLKEGDIITLVDGKALNTMNDLREYIYSKKPNDVVSLQIVRGKINKTIEVTLREKMNVLLGTFLKWTKMSFSQTSPKGHFCPFCTICLYLKVSFF